VKISYSAGLVSSILIFDLVLKCVIQWPGTHLVKNQERTTGHFVQQELKEKSVLNKVLLYDILKCKMMTIIFYF
jgi:hypothetical protein